MNKVGIILILSLVIACGKQMNTNDLSVSMSTSMANQLNALFAKKYISKLIADFSLAPINQIIHANKYLTVNITIDKIKLFNFDNTFTTDISSNSNKSLIFSLANLNTALSFDFSISQTSQANNYSSNHLDNNYPSYHLDNDDDISNPLVFGNSMASNIVVNLQQLNLKLVTHMNFDTSQKTNLSLAITTNVVDYNHVDVNDKDSAIVTYLLNFILNNSLFKKSLGSMLSGNIMKFVNENLFNKELSLQFQLPMSKSNYTVTPLFFQAPEVLGSSPSDYLAVAMGLRLTNSITKTFSTQVPFFNTLPRIGTLPDTQVLMSSNLLHQIAWMITDSDLFTNFLVSDSQVPANSPIHLYTDQLVILVPQLLIKYGAHKGVYLQIDNLMTKESVMVNGRLVVHLSLLVSFLVDPTSTDYPQTSLDKCPQCQNALTFQLNIILGLNLANISPSVVRPLLLSASLQSISHVSTILPDFSQDEFQSLFQDLVLSLVPLVNQNFVQGLQNPLIGKLGVDSMQVRFTQDLLLLSIQTAPTQTQ